MKEDAEIYSNDDIVVIMAKAWLCLMPQLVNSLYFDLKVHTEVIKQWKKCLQMMSRKASQPFTGKHQTLKFVLYQHVIRRNAEIEDDHESWENA